VAPLVEPSWGLRSLNGEGPEGVLLSRFLVLGDGRQGAVLHVQHLDGRSFGYVGLSRWGMLGGLVQAVVPSDGRAAGCIQVEEEGMVVGSVWSCPREGLVGAGPGHRGK